MFLGSNLAGAIMGPSTARGPKMMSRHPNVCTPFSRRAMLKGLGCWPMLLRSAPLFGSPLLGSLGVSAHQSGFPFADIRLTPHYPAQSPLEDIFRLLPPGLDSYVTEKYAFEIEAILARWSATLKLSPLDHSGLADGLDPSIEATTFHPSSEAEVRSAFGVEVTKKQYVADVAPGRERFLAVEEAGVCGLARQ